MAKARNRTGKREQASKRSKAMTGPMRSLKARRKQPKSAMAKTCGLELHIDTNGCWLVDTALGGVQVGEAFQEKDGSWIVDFSGGGFVEAPDLESALQLVANQYDPSRVHVSPMSDAANWDIQEDDDTVIISLPPPDVPGG
jgi:hypothetical protein